MGDTPSLDELLSQDLDVLFENLGEALTKPGFGVSPPNPSQRRLQGKEWLARNRVRLASAICGHPTIIALMQDESTERRVELATILADIIASQRTGIPVFTVAAILVKEGILALCPELASSKSAENRKIIQHDLVRRQEN